MRSVPAEFRGEAAGRKSRGVASVTLGRVMIWEGDRRAEEEQLLPAVLLRVTGTKQAAGELALG